MAVTNKTLVDGQAVAGAITTYYTSPLAGDGTRITAITATNYSAGTESYSVYIKADGSPAGNADLVLLSQGVASNKSDVPPEVINQFVPPGGTIQLSASLSNAISVRISGVEFT